MGRKRGGLAGIWDRNKKVIKPVVSGIAGLVGTPALGAAVGGLMGGLDREGKGGIGFDAKQGLGGAVAGYGAGSLGSMAGGLATKAGLNVGQGALSKMNTGGGKLANMFMGKGPVAPLPSAAGSAPPVTMPPSISGAPPVAPTDAFSVGGASPLSSPGVPELGGFKAFTPPAVPAGALEGSVSGGGTLSRLMGSVEKNPNAWAMGLKGVADLANLPNKSKVADAEARSANADAQEREDENQRRRRGDASLQELRDRLAGMGPSWQSPIAASTYAGYKR